MKFTFAKKYNDSYATYLFIVGADFRNVQELLGHYSVSILIGINSCEQKSLQKIRSPFDNL